MVGPLGPAAFTADCDEHATATCQAPPNHEGYTGALLAWLASGVLEGLLYETRTSDPTTLSGVAVTLIAVACLAALAPALRATRVDPLAVLHED